MSPYRFTMRAAADLEAILAHQSATWSAAQATRYRDRLLECCELLAGEPWIGASCEDVRPGVLRIHEGRHVMFFERDDHGVLIVRILDDSRDPYRHDPDLDDDDDAS